MAPMNTTLTRLSSWSGILLSTFLFLISFLAFVTHPSPSTLTNPNPDATLNITSLQPVYGKAKWHMDRRAQEFLQVEFQIDADLTGIAYYTPQEATPTDYLKPNALAAKAKLRDPRNRKTRSLWNWNTKQVFLWLEVEYRGVDETTGQAGEGPWSRAVVWDRIVRRKQDANVLLDMARNKYGVRVKGGKWSTVPSARFTLRWNVMPHVGMLSYGHEATTGFLPIPALTVQDEGGVRKMQKLPY